MMYVSVNFICGFSLGFEYVPDFDDESHLAIDLGIIRILISKELE